MPECWLHGPSFIRENHCNWPNEPNGLPPITDDILEVRCHAHIVSNKSQSICVNISYFSSMRRMLRCQAQVLRFFYRKYKRGEVTAEEMSDARKYIIREVQQEVFHDEYSTLKAGNVISNDSKLRRYSPYLDPENIIRMKSRIQEAEYVSSEFRNPIILPSKHLLTVLTIDEVHKKYWHSNFTTVLNELRQRYIIPSLRSALSSARHRCQTCKIRRASPEIPEMSPLPASRLAARMKPFSYVGVDCFGPLMIKSGRRVEKRWGVLFTCLTTRAVHIELTPAMSSDAFILTFRCFISRRGEPIEVYCDNGTNFKGASNELRDMMIENLRKLKSELYSSIVFRFNPPCAPHMGGAWERLVRSVKTGLRNAIGEQTLTEHALRAVLSEIEMVINSRPLTYTQTDEHTPEALTPNHFLLGHSSGVKPIGDMTDDTEILKKEWKRQQLITQHFWQRWTNEYLPEISRRTKWYDKAEPLGTGDVVAVVNSSIPNSWQLGRVLEVTKSRDGNIRQACIQTNTGTMRRPVSRIAVLVKERQAEELPSAGGSVKKSNI